MAGVITYTNTEGGPQPVYKKRYLDNVSSEAKTYGILLFIWMIVNIVATIVCVVFFFVLYFQKDSTLVGVPYYILVVLLFYIFCMVVFANLMPTLETYSECCSSHSWSCLFAKKDKSVRIFLITVSIMGLISVFCVWVISIEVLYKIGATLCCVSIHGLLIGLLYFSKKFCQCNRCLGIKDVIIYYGEQTIEKEEFDGITDFLLRKWFNIQSDRMLGIEIDGGEMIHFFTANNPRIQLHKEKYNVKILDFPKPQHIKRNK